MFLLKKKIYASDLGFSFISEGNSFQVNALEQNVTVLSLIPLPLYSCMGSTSYKEPKDTKRDS